MVLENLLIFARAGGGGSGSGGDGGGGTLVVLGYLPPMFVGRWLKKRFSNFIVLPVIIIITILWAGLWFFVGGFFIIVGILALVGGADGYFGWSDVLGRRILNAAKKVKHAAAADPAWQEENLLLFAKETFEKFQKDWTNFNLEAMKSYLTPEYSTHINLMMYALYQKSRQNFVENLEIIKISIVDIHDAVDNTHDRFTVHISAKAKDRLFDTRTQSDIFVDSSPFSEEWQFVRNGNAWLLEGIKQSTVDPHKLQPQIREFAVNNGMYFSPDMGWLLMPLHGDLFGKAKFGNSDINNHVIGVYNNVLTELYTYVPSYDVKSSIVAQATVPKNYGKLVVKHKPKGVFSIFQRTPKGLNKTTLEWPDFNKRYNVYADNVEQVTAFELLHPVFMEKLFALNFPVNIEVADNVVYLYTTPNNLKQSMELYRTMLNILLDAYKEMRL